MGAVSRAWPRRVHLTFDDGPDPVWTPRVAEELDRLGERATFFVIGERAAERPDVVRSLVAAGHRVELHCMRHVRHIDATRAEIEDDTREALSVLRGLGVRPRRWRVPGGRIAPWTAAVARRHRLRLARWSVDPRDWDGESAGRLLERIAPELRPGSTVVLHDGLGPGSGRADCSQTVALIEPLVLNVRLRGWDVAPMPLWRSGSDRRAAPEAWRPGRPHAPPAGFEVAVVPEDELSERDDAALRELLSSVMTRQGAEYRERSWRRLRPEVRTVARAGGKVVGQLSAFRIATKPERVLFGFGDLAVHPDARGRGVALGLTDALSDELRRRGAEVLLADTTALRSRDLRIGYAPVPRFRFWYERDGACHWHPAWLAKVYHPEPKARLELEEGDF